MVSGDPSGSARSGQRTRLTQEEVEQKLFAIEEEIKKLFPEEPAWFHKSVWDSITHQVWWYWATYRK